MRRIDGGSSVTAAHRSFLRTWSELIPFQPLTGSLILILLDAGLARPRRATLLWFRQGGSLRVGRDQDENVSSRDGGLL